MKAQIVQFVHCGWSFPLLSVWLLSWTGFQHSSLENVKFKIYESLFFEFPKLQFHTKHCWKSSSVTTHTRESSVTASRDRKFKIINMQIYFCIYQIIKISYFMLGTAQNSVSCAHTVPPKLATQWTSLSTRWNPLVVWTLFWSRKGKLSLHESSNLPNVFTVVGVFRFWASTEWVRPVSNTRVSKMSDLKLM